MDNQKGLLIAVIITGAVIFSDIIWRAVYYLKHKRDEKATGSFVMDFMVMAYFRRLILIVYL